MATALTTAWKSLKSGRVQDARQSFRGAINSGADRSDGYLGLAATSLAAGDLRDALSLAQKSLDERPSPPAHLLAAESHSRLGNRRQAEQHLEAYLSSGGDAPYARALLGEQRIRTARWDDGLQDYLQALSSDVDGHAAGQLRRVMADLTEVVASGRLPAQPARDFIDSLESQLAQPPPDLQQFFSNVRQALRTERKISAPSGNDPVFEVVGPRQLPDSSSQQNPPSPEQNAASSGPPTSEPGGTDTDSDDDGEGIDPKQKDLAGVIQQDREENEQLQEAIGSMPPPDWPSTPEYGTIDPLPRMNWEEQSIFAHDPGMDATDFRITSGNVRAEIFLERCLQNLLAGASQDRAVSVRFRPEAITRMEVNCWDGLLERLPDLSGIYKEFHEDGDYGMLAVGRFIGECVATPYDGTWDFDDPPDQSKLIIGNTTLDPFGFARRWRESTDKDEIVLEELADQARRAARDSSSLTVEQNYIDPTRELEGQSLGVKLAELWANYLFRLADASFADLAETIEPLDVGASIIVFELDRTYAPDSAAGPEGAALLEGGTVPVAYRRDTGQFLLLASRKHTAQVLASRFGELSAENAPDITKFLATYHRPRWQFVGDQSTASTLSSRTGASLESPALGEQDGDKVLTVHAVVEGTPVELAIRAPQHAEGPWHIETRSH
jgi:tetratricopeptide (TPR) repeat protein